MPDAPMSPPATPASPPAPLLAALDAASLQRLRELDPAGTHGLLARVLDTFAVSLVRHVHELDAARTGADREAIRHVAHTLKSSAASVGALDLSRLCADVERGLREQPEALPAPALLDDMVAQMERLLALAGRALDRR